LVKASSASAAGVERSRLAIAGLHNSWRLGKEGCNQDAKIFRHAVQTGLFEPEVSGLRLS
jgi:hypothetical protein